MPPGGQGLFIVSPDAAAPVLGAGAWASEALLAAARFFAASPLSSLPVPAPSPAASAVFALGVGAFSLGTGRVRWLSLAAPAAVLWVFVGGSLLPGPGLQITFLSVGQGDGIVISSGGRHALVDAGGVPQGADTVRASSSPTCDHEAFASWSWRRSPIRIPTMRWGWCRC